MDNQKDSGDKTSYTFKHDDNSIIDYILEVDPEFENMLNKMYTKDQPDVRLPTDKEIKKLRDILATNIKDGVADLVWGPALEYTTIITKRKNDAEVQEEASDSGSCSMGREEQ